MGNWHSFKEKCLYLLENIIKKEGSRGPLFILSGWKELLVRQEGSLVHMAQGQSLPGLLTRARDFLPPNFRFSRHFCCPKAVQKKKPVHPTNNH